MSIGGDTLASFLMDHKMQVFSMVEDTLEFQPTTHFDMSFDVPERGYPGFSGDKTLVTLSAASPSGETYCQKVFAKRICKGLAKEASHYRALGRLGLPVPKYFGHLDTPGGDEIILIEHLEYIGAHPTDPGTLEKVVKVIARVNATPIVEEYLPILEANSIDKQSKGWLATLSRIQDHAPRAETGELKAFERNHEIDHLMELAERVHGELGEKPLSLSIGDFQLGHFGWRTDDTELVFFDLQNCGPNIRFKNIATLLYKLRKRVGRDEILRLAALYLSELRRQGGCTIDTNTFLRECRWACAAAQLRNLRGALDRAIDGKMHSRDDTARDVVSREQQLAKRLHRLYAEYTQYR